MTRIQVEPISRFSAAGARQRGFSILEFMMAIAVLSIIMGALMTFISAMQRRYTSEAKVASVNQVGKTGMDLMAMDVGQAGFPPGVNTTTTQAITANNTAQTVTLASTVGVYVGRTLLVDNGMSNQESITVNACISTVTGTGCTSGSSNSVTGVFKKGHVNGVPVRASSMPYPQGILYSTTGGVTSNCNSLKIMGDLRGDGSLRYVEYRYTPPPDANTPGVLVRSDTSAFATAESAAVAVVDNLWDSTLFNYKVFANSCTGVPACVSCTTEGSSFTYVTQVGVTMTMRTAAAVERGAGGTRTIIFRQQYFTPRNVIYAINLANDGLQTVLPLAPGTVTTYLGL
jgi:prepilin-type N-terminal cleavage/methylation domain-containing protein